MRYGKQMTTSSSAYLDLLTSNRHISAIEVVIENGLSNETESTRIERPEISFNRFFSQWQDRRSSPDLTGLGVGYVNGASCTLYDCYDEALTLSRALKGVLVFGVYNESQSCCRQSLYSVVQNITECWDEFLRMHPQGHFIQYYYGSGCDAVEEALKVSRHRDRIYLVGINSIKILDHTKSFYYRSLGDVRSLIQKRPKLVTTLPLEPNSMGLLNNCFTDPVFIPAIQHAYYSALQTAPDGFLSHHIRVSKGVAAILNYQYDQSNRLGLFEDAQRTMQTSQYVLKTGGRWPEFMQNRCLDLFIACFRVCDYGQIALRSAVMAFPSSNNGTIYPSNCTTTPAPWVPSQESSPIVMLLVWATYGLAQIILVTMYHSRVWRHLRIIALAIASFSLPMNLLDITVAAAHLHLQDSTRVIMHMNSIIHDVLHIMLKTLGCFIPLLRSYSQRRLTFYKFLAVQGLTSYSIKVRRRFQTRLRKSVTIVNSIWATFIGFNAFIFAMLILIADRVDDRMTNTKVRSVHSVAIVFKLFLLSLVATVFTRLYQTY